MPRLWCHRLPDESTLAALDLPPGRSWEAPDGGTGWIIDPGVDHLSELWLRWAMRFCETGLWPIASSRPRAWDDWGLGRRGWGLHGAYSIPTDVYAMLREETAAHPQDDWLNDTFEQIEDELGRPANRVLAQGSAFDASILGSLLLPPPPKTLVLVPCQRPADAVLALDFGIPNDGKTPGRFTGVLRSWEERFDPFPLPWRV